MIVKPKKKKSNFLKNGKNNKNCKNGSGKLEKSSRSQMMKQTSSLDLSREI